MAAARMQCDEQIVVAVFVCLGDGDLMTKFFEDARPSQRCYAVAVSGPGRRRGSDEDLHRSFESAQAPKPAQRSRRSGVLTNGCYRWLAKQLRISPIVTDQSPDLQIRKMDFLRPPLSECFHG